MLRSAVVLSLIISAFARVRDFRELDGLTFVQFAKENGLSFRVGSSEWKNAEGQFNTELARVLNHNAKVIFFVNL